MVKNRFKPGDKIRRTVNIDTTLKKGEVYTVKRVLHLANEPLYIEEQQAGPWFARNFELVAEIGDKMFKVINNAVNSTTNKPTILRTFDTQSEAEEYAEALITGQVHTSVSVCQELIRMERKIEVSRVPV